MLGTGEPVPAPAKRQEPMEPTNPSQSPGPGPMSSGPAEPTRRAPSGRGAPRSSARLRRRLTGRRSRSSAASHGAPTPAVTSTAATSWPRPSPTREPRVWVDVTAPSHVQVTDIAELLQLHPLIAEDIAERNQRAKVEEIEGTIHIVMFWITFEGAVTEIEVDLVLGPRTLLTVHEPGWDPFTLDQLRGDPGRLLKRGPDYLL